MPPVTRHHGDSSCVPLATTRISTNASGYSFRQARGSATCDRCRRSALTNSHGSISRRRIVSDQKRLHRQTEHHSLGDESKLATGRLYLKTGGCEGSDTLTNNLSNR